MAFWGIEVQPGKPFIQKPNGSRLHISQATLGIGVATNRSTVQCNLGNAAPVFICSLVPGKKESARMNLEFEEHRQVTFSILGVRSVHLTGYYLGRRGQFDDDSESYEEDNADTSMDSCEDEDEYEDSFINDGDIDYLPPTPAPNESESYKEDNADTSMDSSEDEDEYEDSFIHDGDNEYLPPTPVPNKSEEEKPKPEKARKGKVHGRRLREKHEKGESDEANRLQQQNSAAHLVESDEEDFFVYSLRKKKSSTKDSDIKDPGVVMETPLDAAKEKRKRDKSTAMKSVKRSSPPVGGGGTGSTAKTVKRKLRFREGKERETKVKDATRSAAKKVKRKLPFMEGEMQNQALREKRDTKANDATQRTSGIEFEKVPNGENSTISKKKRKKSKLPSVEDRIA